MLRHLQVALIATPLLLGRSQKAVAATAATPTSIKNVVLVHGAFADGSGWDAVSKILEKDGYRVSVAQPPETSYADDRAKAFDIEKSTDPSGSLPQRRNGNESAY